MEETKTKRKVKAQYRIEVDKFHFNEKSGSLVCIIPVLKIKKAMGFDRPAGRWIDPIAGVIYFNQKKIDPRFLTEDEEFEHEDNKEEEKFSPINTGEDFESDEEVDEALAAQDKLDEELDKISEVDEIDEKETEDLWD